MPKEADQMIGTATTASIAAIGNSVEALVSTAWWGNSRRIRSKPESTSPQLFKGSQTSMEKYRDTSPKSPIKSTLSWTQSSNHKKKNDERFRSLEREIQQVSQKADSASQNSTTAGSDIGSSPGSPTRQENVPKGQYSSDLYVPKFVNLRGWSQPGDGANRWWSKDATDKVAKDILQLIQHKDVPRIYNRIRIVQHRPRNFQASFQIDKAAFGECRELANCVREAIDRNSYRIWVHGREVTPTVSIQQSPQRKAQYKHYKDAVRMAESWFGEGSVEESGGASMEIWFGWNYGNSTAPRFGRPAQDGTAFEWDNTALYENGVGLEKWYEIFRKIS